MAVVRPFPALRPRAGLASRIAAVPYDVVNTDEARALASDPLSFLHVSRAEIDLPPATDPYADAVYARAGTTSSAEARGRSDRGGRGRRLRLPAADGRARPDRGGGVLLGGRVPARSHQEAREDAAGQGKRSHPAHHRHAGAERPGAADLSARRRRSTPRSPASSTPHRSIAFTAADGIEHTVWRTRAGAGRRHRAAFADVPALYIADGHHRAASAARAAEPLRRPKATRRPAWFLAVAFPDTEMQILPYHRVVKDLGGRTAEAFLAERARRTCRWRPAARTSRTQGPLRDVSGGALARARPRRRRHAAGDPVAALDVQRLQDRVLAPLLGIADPRTDKRIDFVGGIRGTGELTRLVDSGQAAAAFALYPDDGRRPDGDRRRRRHHAAQVHLVRAQAARRPADARDSVIPDGPSQSSRSTVTSGSLGAHRPNRPP